MQDLKALRVIMLMRSCSPAELATAIGISVTALYRRLNGKVAFTVPEMLKCAQYLGLTDTERDDVFFKQKVAFRLHGEMDHECS